MLLQCVCKMLMNVIFELSGNLAWCTFLCTFFIYFVYILIHFYTLLNNWCTSQYLKITQNIEVEFIDFGHFHQVLSFKNWPVWQYCLTTSFMLSKLDKLTIFGILKWTFVHSNENVAHFARSVEWDFFCDFQTQCTYSFIHFRKGNKNHPQLKSFYFLNTL